LARIHLERIIRMARCLAPLVDITAFAFAAAF